MQEGGRIGMESGLRAAGMVAQAVRHGRRRNFCMWQSCSRKLQRRNHAVFSYDSVDSVKKTKATPTPFILAGLSALLLSLSDGVRGLRYIVCRELGPRRDFSCKTYAPALYHEKNHVRGYHVRNPVYRAFDSRLFRGTRVPRRYLTRACSGTGSSLYSSGAHDVFLPLNPASSIRCRCA